MNIILDKDKLGKCSATLYGKAGALDVVSGFPLGTLRDTRAQRERGSKVISWSRGHSLEDLLRIPTGARPTKTITIDTITGARKFLLDISKRVDDGTVSPTAGLEILTTRGGRKVPLWGLRAVVGKCLAYKPEGMCEIGPSMDYTGSWSNSVGIGTMGWYMPLIVITDKLLFGHDYMCGPHPDRGVGYMCTLFDFTDVTPNVWGHGNYPQARHTAGPVLVVPHMMWKAMEGMLRAGICPWPEVFESNVLLESDGPHLNGTGISRCYGDRRVMWSNKQIPLHVLEEDVELRDNGLRKTRTRMHNQVEVVTTMLRGSMGWEAIWGGCSMAPISLDAIQWLAIRFSTLSANIEVRDLLITKLLQEWSTGPVMFGDDGTKMQWLQAKCTEVGVSTVEGREFPKVMLTWDVLKDYEIRDYMAPSWIKGLFVQILSANLMTTMPMGCEYTSRDGIIISMAIPDVAHGLHKAKEVWEKHYKEDFGIAKDGRLIPIREAADSERKGTGITAAIQEQDAREAKLKEELAKIDKGGKASVQKDRPGVDPIVYGVEPAINMREVERNYMDSNEAIGPIARRIGTSTIYQNTYYVWGGIARQWLTYSSSLVSGIDQTALLDAMNECIERSREDEMWDGDGEGIDLLGDTFQELLNNMCRLTLVACGQLPTTAFTQGMAFSIQPLGSSMVFVSIDVWSRWVPVQAYVNSGLSPEMHLISAYDIRMPVYRVPTRVVGVDVATETPRRVEGMSTSNPFEAGVDTGPELRYVPDEEERESLVALTDRSNRAVESLYRDYVRNNGIDDERSVEGEGDVRFRVSSDEYEYYNGIFVWGAQASRWYALEDDTNWRSPEMVYTGEHEGDQYRPFLRENGVQVSIMEPSDTNRVYRTLTRVGYVWNANTLSWSEVV